MECPNYRRGRSCGSCVYAADIGNIEEVVFICKKATELAGKDECVDFAGICDWYISDTSET